jgi:hypothetical protein
MMCKSTSENHQESRKNMRAANTIKTDLYVVIAHKILQDLPHLASIKNILKTVQHQHDEVTHMEPTIHWNRPNTKKQTPITKLTINTCSRNSWIAATQNDDRKAS